MLNSTLDVGMESIFETTSRIDVQTPTSVAPFPITTPTMTSSTIATTTLISQAPILPIPIPSDVIQHLPSFSSLFRFDDRLRSLEQNFSEVMQTNQFTDRLREEAQRENDEFLRTVDENINKIIKEQVKEQVKAQVSKILPRIEQAVNEQLEAEVLTRSSYSSRTSYVVVADLSEMELKKILIEKMEGNKSIQRSDKQRNLYKALVDAYESDKIILNTYGESVTLKRRRDDDEDRDEEPSAGPNRGSKRRREGKEPESTSTPSETATKSAGKSTAGVDTLTPELLAGPPYDLVKGSCKSLIELEYHLEEVYKSTTDQLDWVNPKRHVEDLQLGVESYQKKLNLTKPDTYRSDLKRKEAYTAYSNPWGFIYQNKDKQNRLMRIDELHKFSDGTLTDVRTALDDRLKGIRMQYLPQTIWRRSDKDGAAAMIQAIDKRIKTKRVMRSLERFVGGRLYEGDFRMLQRTI
uniref:Uncharacterized protein n=1 Tax=Tanacetum cinerariifolium TaxID=118510 RepID=A0A699KC26_TANCI|nr:hypothetical protein [Tanacetum cinerariifolium]